MKTYINKNGSLTELTPDVPLFDTLNTHAGDKQIVNLTLDNAEGTDIRNLMLELSIVDEGIETILKKGTNTDNSVTYLRRKTLKSLRFYVDYIDENGGYTPIKPDSNGLLLVSKFWDKKDRIQLRVTIVVDEMFSNKFGELVAIQTNLSWFGETDVKKTFK